MDYKEILRNEDVKMYLKNEMKTLVYWDIQTIQRNTVQLLQKGQG